eukprot:1161761-Pelagomonas_calceolata.AAC.5
MSFVIAPLASQPCFDGPFDATVAPSVLFADFFLSRTNRLVLHDAFFKYQTKPKLTQIGEMYYEGKEFEARVENAKPGVLSEDLRKWVLCMMDRGTGKLEVQIPWCTCMYSTVYCLALRRVEFGSVTSLVCGVPQLPSFFKEEAWVETPNCLTQAAPAVVAKLITCHAC